MATEIYKEHKQAIVFSPPVHLTNEFFEKSHTASLVNASNVILDAYHSLGAKKTQMAAALASIVRYPARVHDSEAVAGIQKQAKKGEAIYSVKVITDSETQKVDTQVFSLHVGKDFTEVSYMKNDELVELHRQQEGKGIIHEINIV